MESATFQKWLAEHGCRFDTAAEKRGTGHANVTVHREGRKAEVPLGGPPNSGRTAIVDFLPRLTPDSSVPATRTSRDPILHTHCE
jgi:ribosome-interacting GTPase 1